MSGDVHAAQGSDLPLAERAAWTLGLGAFWAAGYFALGNAAGKGSAWSLATPIDELIPFIPWSVWAYLMGLALIAMPALVSGSRSHFRRTALAYGVVLAVSLACFALFPVTSASLRPESTSIPGGGLTSWALRELYAIDPPYNLCPSLHASLCVLAASSVWRTSRMLGTAAAAISVLVMASVCTIKQHFVLDAVTGVSLAVAVQMVV